jgi:UDP-N-acetylglucosamine diphosphorylase / glucose-1-phosphate thymidylyltransferase / UDP-N-acetylgalactosamine diphosphorylase / glucosamine-1-phosphate N-acetyltransferase / galactosamine-1-phosphate N-acetyltransferase
MPELKLLLFDDEIGRAWQPFALTRPVGELLFGVLTFRERAERVFGVSCSGHLTSGHLTGFEEEGAAPVVMLDSISTSSPRLFLLSRFLPHWDQPRPTEWPTGPIATRDGVVVGWYAAPGTPNPDRSFLLAPAGGAADAERTLDGTILEHPWNLVSLNPDQITRDIEALFPDHPPAVLPAGTYHWGEHPLVVDDSATIEPGAVFDTSNGPVWLDMDSRVRAFSRVAGPAYIGRGSTVLGGPVEAVSIGPVCRVRGELAESVCLGYTNKQHDGHMGHAYLGRWVNLGAETTNSDLKNNYGTIRMWTPGGEVDTGEIKMGSLIGDHVKTGIGLLLNTGTLIGAGSNLYGAAMPPTYVPPFSWGTGGELVEYRLDKFLEVTERAMGRRQVELSSEMREQLSSAWRLARVDTGTEAKPTR